MTSDGPCLCAACLNPLDNNPAIDGALVICGECISTGTTVNPRLIAAAPELLAALRDLIADADANRDRGALASILIEHAPKLRAAIRKATGE